MFNMYVLIVGVLPLLAGCSACIDKKDVHDNMIPSVAVTKDEVQYHNNISSDTIMGGDVISDKALKNVVLTFFGSVLEPLVEFQYLSKTFLSKNYPGISTAEEYETYQKNYRKYLDEVSGGDWAGESKYLEVVGCAKIVENEYKVEMIRLGIAHNIRQKTKESFSFVKEDSSWKYNGEIPSRYVEVIE